MSTPTMTYEVHAHIVRPGVSRVHAKHETIAFDSSPQSGDELPGPAELLCSAFAACLLKNVERFSEMLPFEQHGASLRVTAERQQDPPRFTTIRWQLTLTTDEPPRRVDMLRRNLIKYGTVYNTLAAACDVSGEVLTVAPGDAGPREVLRPSR